MRPNYEKKLFKTTCTKKLEKVTNFLILQNHIKPKKNSFQRIGYIDARKTIGNHNRLRKDRNKNEKLKKKLRKIVPIFAIFCHISQQNDS